MTTGKTIALTRWTFVDKVMSLLINYSLKAVSRAFLRPTSVGLLCHNYAIIYDCSSFPEGLCHENHCLMYFVGVTFAHSTQEGKLEAVHSVLVRNTWQLQTVHSVVLLALLTTSCSPFLSQCDISSPGSSFLDPVYVKFCYVIIELFFLRVSV